jgi:hypothetical protein
MQNIITLRAESGENGGLDGANVNIAMSKEEKE